MAKKSEWEDFEMTQQFNLRISPEHLKAVDDWRRQQEDLPGRSQAIRKLLELALTAEKIRPR
jgi:hypothetical protein